MKQNLNEKQIEEIERMTKIIYNTSNYSKVMATEIATYNVKHNYKRVKEDSVVLSMEEYKHINSCYNIVRKETAEKILNYIITKLIDNVAIEGDWELEDFEYSGEEIKEVLDELGKQFNVEIKE